MKTLNDTVKNQKKDSKNTEFDFDAEEFMSEIIDSGEYKTILEKYKKLPSDELTEVNVEIDEDIAEKTKKFLVFQDLDISLEDLMVLILDWIVKQDHMNFKDPNLKNTDLKNTPNIPVKLKVCKPKKYESEEPDPREKDS